jgi:hypothetical protein
MRGLRALLILLALSAHALTAQSPPLYPFPAWPPLVSGLPGLSGTYVLDAASEKACIIYAATTAKEIDKVHFRTGTVTTGDTVDVRVETVDDAANGDPTGTLFDTDSNIAVAVANGDDNVWKSGTLTANATPAIGDVVAVCVTNGGGGGNMTLANYAETTSGFPYGDLFAAAAWAKQLSPLMVVVEYSDGSFEPTFGYHDSGGPINTNSYDSNDATNRRGNIFTLIAAATARGCWAWIDADAAFSCKVYGANGTDVVATTAEANAFQRQSTGAGIQFYPFLASASLSAGVNYRVAIVPSVTTATVTTYNFDVHAAGVLDMFAGGTEMHSSIFTSSAWVETTTRREYVGLMLEAVVATTGGGRIIGGH